MSIDIDKLEQLARAASRGPWQWNERHGSVTLDCPDEPTNDHVLMAEPIGYENSSVLVDDPDAAYIAAASPDVVLALIERLRAAEAGR